MPGPQLKYCQKCSTPEHQVPVIFNKDFFEGVEENYGKRWGDMSKEEKMDAGKFMGDQNTPMFLNPDGSPHDCKAKNAPSAESSAESKATSAASTPPAATPMEPSIIEFMASFLQVLNRISTQLDTIIDNQQQQKQNGRKGAKP